MGYEDAQPTPQQQAEMERVLAEAMAQGACGMSTGLAYPPGIYCHTGEVIGLAKVVARHGGIYASHIRDESAGVLDAIDEALEIGIRAGVPVQCSHVKISGFHNWNLIDQLLTALNSEKARDARLGCDQYPYTAGHTWLAGILPHWAQAGGSKAIAHRLRERDVRDRLTREWGDNRGGARDWSGILVTDCVARPEVVGKNIAEIAAGDGKAPLEAAFDLIAISESQVACVFFSQDEGIMKTLMREPFVSVGSDSSARAPYGVLGKTSTHPRAYGTFARVLGRYVREERVLTLEEAVKKMTSMTAERFGLTDRGVIREGAWADLVLFDAQSVSDRATYTDPHQYAGGIPYVLVNGTVVIDQGQHTGALPGQVL
jgi:N-acyl-D-amino-acid deacylase